MRCMDDAAVPDVVPAVAPIDHCRVVMDGEMWLSRTSPARSYLVRIVPTASFVVERGWLRELRWSRGEWRLR